MRRGNRSLVRSLVALYALLLRLYPVPFRQSFGAEMVGVFRDSLEAAEAAGTGAVLRVAWRELLGFPRNVVAARRSVPVNPGSRRPGWRAWIAWVFLSTLAIPAAWAITFGGIWVAEAVIGQTMMHLGRITPTQDVVATYLFFPAFALFLGGVQWAILRRYLPRAGRWLLATTAGWLGGFAAIYLLAILGRRYPQTLPQEWQLELILPLLGLCVSIAQWLALRHDVRRAGWLVLANVIAFATIRLITGGRFNFVESLTLALLPAINTGLVLIWLLRYGNGGSKGTAASKQEAEAGSTAAASHSPEISSSAAMPARRHVRLALLLLWIVAILGPWTYTLDGVPPAEWCDERYVLIAEDRCADLVSGLAMLAWMPLMAVTAVAELFTDGFGVFGRILPVAAIYALMILPLISSLLLLVRGDTPRRQRVHFGMMLFAVPVGSLLPFLLNGAYGMVISLRLWGLWLFVVVCAVALLFELLIRWRRPPFHSQRLAPTNPAA